MHNGRLANGQTPEAKALKSATSKMKQSQSEADAKEVSRIEFEGSLYHDSTIGPFIPVDNCRRC
jgi:hypothetical protein